MRTRTLLIAASVSIAALTTCQADEPVRVKLAQSIPTDVVFCARLDLNAARKEEQAERLLDATKQKFKEQLEAVEKVGSLDLQDVDSIWVGVVKDKECLVILEGSFDTDRILNSPIVTSSRRMVKPGTIVAIEINDEKTGEPSHAVAIDDGVIAFGLPRLVDRFVANYVNGKSGWDKNGLAVMASLAASNAMFYVALTQIPAREIKEKPFLATVVNAQLELTIRERVAATAKIAMQDESKATALRDLVSGFVGLGLTSEIKMDYPDIKQAILGSLKLSAEGKTVNLSAAMDTELLRKLLRAKGLDLN